MIDADLITNLVAFGIIVAPFVVLVVMGAGILSVLEKIKTGF
jgi:hypothetical protein